MRQRRSEPRAFVCMECGKVYASSFTLWQHKKTHGEKKFKCTVCEKKFHYKSHLASHMATHSKSLTKTFKCNDCQKMFSRKSCLVAHVSRKHAQHQICRCQYCNQEFPKLAVLDKHKKTCEVARRNGIEPTNREAFKEMYTCDICHKYFKTVSGLACHLKRSSAHQYNPKLLKVSNGIHGVVPEPIVATSDLNNGSKPLEVRPHSNSVASTTMSSHLSPASLVNNQPGTTFNGYATGTLDAGIYANTIAGSPSADACNTISRGNELLGERNLYGNEFTLDYLRSTRRRKQIGTRRIRPQPSLNIIPGYESTLTVDDNHAFEDADDMLNDGCETSVERWPELTGNGNYGLDAEMGVTGNTDGCRKCQALRDTSREQYKVIAELRQKVIALSHELGKKCHIMEDQARRMEVNGAEQQLQKDILAVLLNPRATSQDGQTALPLKQRLANLLESV